MQVYETLAALDFGGILANASYQTKTGKELLEKYQSYTMANEVTCKVVNQFISEAKNCLYDSGVNSVYENVCKVISNNKYSWMLATACESIEADQSSYSYLNKNAAKQVRTLLEMKEDEVVSYVKAGALKNVMYCESFRNIAKAIFKDQPVVEQKAQYTVTHPISIVEKKDDDAYFVVSGNIYKINNAEHTISEAFASEVSNEFLQIARILESNLVSYENGTISFTDRNMTISINENGVIKTTKDKSIEMTVQQLREHNSLYLNTIMPTQRGRYAEVLEGIAKIADNFDNIAILDSVSLISTPNDLFLCIENENQMFAKSLKSNHSSPWQVNENLYETIQFIKKRTYVDLNEEYSDKIQKVIEQVEKHEGEKIQESIKQSELLARKQKIEELIQEYKNDPARLAVLSKAAEKLGRML